MASDKFCLRWNDFESNISVAFRELREDKDFFDVTLACDDQQIQAHKVILSACSPFFRTILKRNPHAHPLLYLRSVKFSDLQSVLSFMYHGEVNVAQEDLNSFLAVAEELKVKGLTQGNQQSSSTPSSKPSAYPAPPARPKPSPRPPDRDSAPPPKRPRPPYPAAEEEVEEVQEVVGVKQEPVSQAITPVVEMGDYAEEYEDYGQEYGAEAQGYEAGVLTGAEGNKGLYPDFASTEDFDVYIARDGPVRICTLCGLFKNKTITNVRCHIESKHFPGIFNYTCQICAKVCNSKTAFRDHSQSCKKQQMSQLSMQHPQLVDRLTDQRDPLN